MPDGRLLSLPIPVTQEQEEGEEGIPYREMRFGGQPISDIIDQLTDGQFDMTQQAHLDPDLDEGRFPPRKRGWTQTFGQTGRPQTHLEKQRVGRGDLFLFFGWFRRTICDADRLCYVRPKDGGKDLHVIFGWLQIGDRYNVNEQFEKLPPWLDYHPHVENRALYQRLYDHNKIYIAREDLELPGRNLHLRGGGTFLQFKNVLQLTAPEETRRSYWRLPKWFYHENQKVRLSYHHNNKKKRWQSQNNHVILQSASPGQEFVLNTEYYPDAVTWVRSLFEDE